MMNSSCCFVIRHVSTRQRHRMQYLFNSVAHVEASNHTWAEDAPAAGVTWFSLHTAWPLKLFPRFLHSNANHASFSISKVFIIPRIRTYDQGSVNDASYQLGCEHSFIGIVDLKRNTNIFPTIHSLIPTRE